MGSSDTATYIRTVARYRNISVAAEELGITQPALSARIRKVEERLGAALFDRSHSPLTITQAGRAYLACQDEIDAANRKLMRQLGDLTGLESGSLTVGGAAFFNTTVLPPAIAEFGELHPKVGLTVVDSTVPELTQAALEGRLDLFITPSVNENADLAYDRLLEERIFLCVPPEAAERAGLPRAEGTGFARIGKDEARGLADETFVKLDNTLQIGQRMDALLKRWEISPARVVHVDQMLIGLSLTAAGAGCSLVTESALANYAARELPPHYLADEDLCTRTLYVAHGRGALFSSAAREFVRLLQQHAADLRLAE